MKYIFITGGGRNYILSLMAVFANFTQSFNQKGLQEIIVGKAVFALLFTFLGMAASVMAEQKRELIGRVYDKPIYRDELDIDENGLKGEYLRHLILPPLMEKLRERHRVETEPTREELAETEQYFLRPGMEQAGDIADWFLGQWKTQRYLYLNYGGGRILWQQAGMEAFDATHKWLKAEEKAGHFVIHDVVLRSNFYYYWSDMNHGSFLTDDKVRIKEEFLTPDWVPARYRSIPGQ